MPTLIKKRKHLYIRIPLGLLVIAFIALGPVLIGMVGSVATEWLTGNSCHEGNCAWAAMGWFVFLTLPVGGFLLLIFIVIVLKDIIQLNR